ncbi:unnamed protein product [Ilex paraguariensis]|uniref:Beta-amyrin synthase n=1 Tax=Ilex paraguariensis TaxID=185542 RepID=A0ABC8R9N6_9AQUA
MWKLKVAEGHGPWLFSTNNFLGRQIWEYDPDLGTPTERAQVEKAREEYRKNRFRIRPSSDILVRMQLIKENQIDLTIPPVEIGETEEVTHEIVTTSLTKAVRLLSAIQAHDGHWPSENSGPLIYTTPMVSSLYIRVRVCLFCG